LQTPIFPAEFSAIAIGKVELLNVVETTFVSAAFRAVRSVLLEYSHGEEGTLAGGTGPCRHGKKDSRITLGPVLDIRAASPLRDGLQKALKRGKPIVLDAAQVDRLSTPCIQVLLAAGKSAEAAAGRNRAGAGVGRLRAAFSTSASLPTSMSWQAEA